MDENLHKRCLQFIIDRDAVKAAFPMGNSVSFSSMIREQGAHSDRVATFLAILQLIQSGRISFEKKDNDYIISLNLEKKGA